MDIGPTLVAFGVDDIDPIPSPGAQNSPEETTVDVCRAGGVLGGSGMQLDGRTVFLFFAVVTARMVRMQPEQIAFFEKRSIRNCRHHPNSNFVSWSRREASDRQFCLARSSSSASRRSRRTFLARSSRTSRNNCSLVQLSTNLSRLATRTPAARVGHALSYIGRFFFTHDEVLLEVLDPAHLAGTMRCIVRCHPD